MATEDPKLLYRYRHLEGDREWTKEILTKSTLYFASPKSFNDPLDCKVHFRSAPSDDQMRKYYADLLKRNMPVLNREQRRMKVAEDLATKRPDEFLENISTDLQNAVNNLGVLSFSATNNNVLLWSHYAANHTGLCLVFQATNTTPFFGMAQQVDYCQNYPKIALLKNSPNEQVQAFLLTKAVDWKYEEEWRIIDHDTGIGIGAKTFPEELLVGIIFGVRMKEKDKTEVVNWVNQRKSAIQLSQASLVSGSFSLNIEPYEP